MGLDLMLAISKLLVEKEEAKFTGRPVGLI
jgi:hypothetical protein